MNDFTAGLAQTCKDEGIDITPDALTLLAEAVEGSQDYAERLLEQLVSSYAFPLTEEHVRYMLQRSLDNADAYFERANTYRGSIAYPIRTQRSEIMSICPKCKNIKSACVCFRADIDGCDCWDARKCTKCNPNRNRRENHDSSR